MIFSTSQFYLGKNPQSLKSLDNLSLDKERNLFPTFFVCNTNETRVATGTTAKLLKYRIWDLITAAVLPCCLYFNELYWAEIFLKTRTERMWQQLGFYIWKFLLFFPLDPSFPKEKPSFINLNTTKSDTEWMLNYVAVSLKFCFQILHTGIAMIKEAVTSPGAMRITSSLPLCQSCLRKKKYWALFGIILFKSLFRLAFSASYTQLHLQMSNLCSFPLSGEWQWGTTTLRTTNSNSKCFVPFLSFIEQKKMQPYVKPI